MPISETTYMLGSKKRPNVYLTCSSNCIIIAVFTCVGYNVAADRCELCCYALMCAHHSNSQDGVVEGRAGPLDPSPSVSHTKVREEGSREEG